MSDCEIILLGLSDKPCSERTDDDRDWCDFCRRPKYRNPNFPSHEVQWGDDH